MQIFVLLLAAAFVLAGTQVAMAAPIIPAIVAFAQLAIIPGILTVGQVLGAGLLFGGSLLLQSLQKKPAVGQSDPGIQFEVRMGDNDPLAFPMGQTACAGSRNYIGTFGEDGATPNAYLVDELEISSIPVPGQPSLWVNGEKVTIRWDLTPEAQGYPVQESFANDRYHQWALYEDGSSFSPNSYLRARFGDDPDHPYTSDMIGRGCARIIITTLYNRELYPGPLQLLVEPPVAVWYDIRKDSTAGGSGLHRWHDKSTWEPSDNPVVLIYNIIRGVYYGSDWLWGGRNLPAFRLPASNWMAAANECDVLVDIPDGEEKQYRAGMEIRVDMEPLGVIEELKKVCCARIAEVGGIFKIQVNVQTSAVYSFTASDIVVTDEQRDMPFPTLDNTYNGVEITYPEPEEMWADKDAPPIYNGEYEEADYEQRLVPGVQLKACPFAHQVQRVGAAIVAENRRFRHHILVLPPDAYPLEPNDTVAMTDASRGYSNKKFIVHSMLGKRTTNQLVTVKEIDPTDFEFDVDDYRPISVTPPGRVRPPAQEMQGFQVFPAEFNGNDGLGRRPSIRVQYPGNLDDVRSVHVQVRTNDANKDIVFDGELPYGEISSSPKSVILNGNFLPATNYEVRAVLVPFTVRAALYSSWLAVTTPDTRLSEEEFDDHARAMLEQIRAIDGKVATARGELDNLNGAMVDAITTMNERMGQTQRRIGVRNGQNRASFDEIITAIARVDATIASIFQGVYARTGPASAESSFRMSAISQATADAYEALGGIEFITKAAIGGLESSSAFKLLTVLVAGQLQSRAVIDADLIDFIVGGVRVPVRGLQRGDEARTVSISGGGFTVDFRTLHKTYYLNLTSTVKPLPPVGWDGAEATLLVRNAASYGFTDPDLDTFILPSAGVAQPKTGADALSVFGIGIATTSPLRWYLYKKHDGVTTAGAVRLLSVSPAISGKNVWNLDTDGPLVIGGPWSGTISVLGSRLDTTIEAFGAGGNSGALSHDFNLPGQFIIQPGQSGDTTFNGMIAGAGQPSLSKFYISGVFGTGTAGGAAGTASGAGSNLNGNPGEAGGYVQVGNQYYAYAGYGAAAPAPGGALIAGDYTAGTLLAINGDPPGGGARGVAYRGSASPTQIDGTGGGGSGAKFTKTYNAGTPLATGVYALTVGGPGTIGQGTIANGGLGGYGRIIFY
jgi:hypothetical protein